MRSETTIDRQSYRERRPAPGLEPYVSCVWVQRVPANAPAYEHRTVPNGCVEIICALETGAIWITGPQRHPLVGRRAPGSATVGVRFHPGAAHPVLGPPASELVDLRGDLDSCWGPAAVRLGDRLAGSASPQAAIGLLEEVLLARSAAAANPDPLVTEAVRRLQPWAGRNIDDVNRELFVSERQLRRRFVGALGYGPKQLQRILRFQAFLALTQVQSAESGRLVRLAHAAGYADQAHLSRECLRLTGLSPTLFLQEMSISCGANHDHDASFVRLRHALARRGTPRRDGRFVQDRGRSIF